MKRIISVFLALIICVTGFTVSASAAPTINVTRTYKSGYTYVKLNCSGYDLYYTTDGTKPDKNDKEYTKKLKITTPTTLRVSAYKNGKRKVSITTEIKVRVDSPKAELYAREGDYSIYYIEVPSGTTAYVTFDGTTPSKKNGEKLTSDALLEYWGSGEIKMIAYKSGWKKSKVRTVKIEVEETSAGDYAEEVLRLVNAEREKNGLSALKINDKLQEAAQVRAEELLTYYDHTRPNGSSCFTVLSEFNISLSAAAENIAAGYYTPEAVVEGWMNSTGHRENILGNFKYIGIGLAYGGDYGVYWTQLFTA